MQVGKLENVLHDLHSWFWYETIIRGSIRLTFCFYGVKVFRVLSRDKPSIVVRLLTKKRLTRPVHRKRIHIFSPIVNYSDSAPRSDKKTEIRLDGVIIYHLQALKLSDTEKYLEHRKRRRGRWGKITRFSCYPTQKCTDSPHTARENKTKVR